MFDGANSEMILIGGVSFASTVPKYMCGLLFGVMQGCLIPKIRRLSHWLFVVMVLVTTVNGPVVCGMPNQNFFNLWFCGGIDCCTQVLYL